MGLFKKAERKKAFLKIGITGVSGSGKTYSALLLAQGLGGKIAMIDTENGSGELYSNLCDYDVAPMEAPFTPQKYVEYIKAAEEAGYNVLIIDSLSHAWSGEGGVLEMVDKVSAASRSGNSFSAWKDITPAQNKMVNAILQSKMDIIVCMRSKQAYEIVENDRGKKAPVKIGLAPVQREGLEYEFTVMFDIAVEKHIATTSKDRTGLFASFCDVITPEVGRQIREWSESGATFVADKFVTIKGDTVTVLTKVGMIDIKDLPTETLEKMAQAPQYQLAHAAIRDLLAAWQAEEEIPEAAIPPDAMDEGETDAAPEPEEQLSDSLLDSLMDGQQG